MKLKSEKVSKQGKTIQAEIHSQLGDDETLMLWLLKYTMRQEV